MAVTVTRSLHPLPFENLDPRRFEDLIRQLAYDFRRWRALEATGRSGSDESFDVRGWEVVNEEIADRDDDDSAEQDTVSFGEDRLWLIQGKREKSIGPTKLARYVDGIPNSEPQKIYGVIIAAPCDFSKTSRDRFRERCHAAGFTECYLWSRAELEDMLYQPKNDGLLFAYFGISLTIRRRASLSRLRSRLSIKRKLHRAFGDGEYVSRQALFLDPDDEQYPFLGNAEKPFEDLPWKIYEVAQFHPLGILIRARQFEAYLHDDRIQWDMADAVPSVGVFYQNPWRSQDEMDKIMVMHSEVREWLLAYPSHNQAIITINSLLRFDEILEIDKDGDTMFKGPIIYVKMTNGDIPAGCVAELVTCVSYSDDEHPTRVIREAESVVLPTTIDNRIEMFPAKYRKPIKRTLKSSR
jgi:hypothetical protein